MQHQLIFLFSFRILAVIFTLISLSGLPGLATAGQTTELEVIGFSPDGQYAAIIESTYLDGTGFPWVRAAVVDTLTNRFRGEPLIFRYGDEVSEIPELDAVVEEARQAIAPRSVGLTFDAWLQGETLRVTDDGQVTGGGSVLGSLSLEERSSVRQPPVCHDLDLTAKIVTLTLFYAGGEQVLNSDRYLPKSRKCPFRYFIGNTAWRLGDSLVVNLRYATPGWEGPDVWSIPVGAKVDGLGNPDVQLGAAASGKGL